MRLKIKNWIEFQHYKDRCPPWIKLHISILTSRVWVTSSDQDKLLAIACMLLASQDKSNDGSFDADPDYIKRACYLEKLPNFNGLISNGFLDYCNQALADASVCNQKQAKATTEERRGETETETEVSASPRHQHDVKKQKPRKTTLPDNFAISENVRAWATEKGFSNLDARLEYFKGVSLAKGYEYADWDAAFRNSISADWAKLGKATLQTVPSEETDAERKHRVAVDLMRRIGAI